MGFLCLSLLISSSQVKHRPQAPANGKEEERLGSLMAMHPPVVGAHQRLSVGKAMELTESSAAKPPTLLFHKKPGAVGVPTAWRARETHTQGETGKATTLWRPFPQATGSLSGEVPGTSTMFGCCRIWRGIRALGGFWRGADPTQPCHGRSKHVVSPCCHSTPGKMKTKSNYWLQIPQHPRQHAGACLGWDELSPTGCGMWRRWVLTALSPLPCAAAAPQRGPRRSPGCRLGFPLSSLPREPRGELHIAGWLHPLSAKWRKSTLKTSKARGQRVGDGH